MRSMAVQQAGQLSAGAGVVRVPVQVVHTCHHLTDVIWLRTKKRRLRTVPQRLAAPTCVVC